MTSEQTDSPDQQEKTPLQQFLASRNAVILLIVLIVGSLIAICTMGYFLIRSLNDDPVAADNPTPFPTDGLTIVQQGSDVLVVGISDSTTISVTLDSPTLLRLGGQDFPVQAQKISGDGIWSAAFDEESETAVWVYGSIVNYLVGLPASEQNRAMLEAMTPGDQMVLTTQQGLTYAFEFEGRNLVPAGNRDVFSQFNPGITLLLLGEDGEERLVVNGRYIESTATNDSSSGIIQLGETTRLVDSQITVTGASYIPDRPEAPPGFAFFLVDFEIQNVGLTALDTNRFQLTLTDQIGNQYALNPIASQLGNNPALSGFLNAGQTRLATAGYQIPTGLVSTSLNWFVSQPDAGAQVQVTIPFNGGGQAGNLTQISLQSVTVSTDLSSLILTGQIANGGQQPVVVPEGAITLTTPDGSFYLLLSTNPAFPWTVAPGQTAPFSVTFQRPVNTDTAVFTVLNQPFQLQNLR